MRFVGLILAPASEEMAARPGLERMTGQQLTGKGFVGLMPREFALTVLRGDAPATFGLDRAERSRPGAATAAHGGDA